MKKLENTFEKISEMHSRGCKAAVFVNIAGETAVTAPNCARFKALEDDSSVMLAGIYSETAKSQDVYDDVRATVEEMIAELSVDSAQEAIDNAKAIELFADA